MRVLIEVGHNRSPLQMGTWISTILSTPTSGDLEHVMAMTSHVATGLEAKIEHSNTHSCSGSISVSGNLHGVLVLYVPSQYTWVS
jgi:hypothetical protein